jgi:hypothetical protein
MRKPIVPAIGLLLLTTACSTPLPCVFNDTPQCEARWRPTMERQVDPNFLYNAGAAMSGPPIVAPAAPTQTICRPQSAGNDVWLACQ